jgi:TPR repeat protein
MIIVHELVGHGIQHLNGWLDWVREIDLECNANLYGERFYQDVGIDKKSREVVQFRRALESHWCADFKAHMKQDDPAVLALWDVLDPDIPRLLAEFDRYVEAMRHSGAAAQAIEAARAMRLREIDEGVRKQAVAGDRDAQYRLALLYRDGIGLDADPRQAAEWFYRAALQGDARAQLNLGVLYANGTGVARDLSESLIWLRKAAAQGSAEAKRIIEQLRAATAPKGGAGAQPPASQ